MQRTRKARKEGEKKKKKQKEEEKEKAVRRRKEGFSCLATVKFNGHEEVRGHIRMRRVAWQLC